MPACAGMTAEKCGRRSEALDTFKDWLLATAKAPLDRVQSSPNHYPPQAITPAKTGNQL